MDTEEEEEEEENEIFLDVSIRCDPNRLDDFCTASGESRINQLDGIKECSRSLKAHPVNQLFFLFAYAIHNSIVIIEDGAAFEDNKKNKSYAQDTK